MGTKYQQRPGETRHEFRKRCAESERAEKLSKSHLRSVASAASAAWSSKRARRAVVQQVWRVGLFFCVVALVLGVAFLQHPTLH